MKTGESSKIHLHCCLEKSACDAIRVAENEVWFTTYPGVIYLQTSLEKNGPAEASLS